MTKRFDHCLIGPSNEKILVNAVTCMQTNGPVLTFKSDKFIFINPLFSHREMLKKNSYWQKDFETDEWVTTNPKAAAAYRRHADDNAEKYFQRVFVSFYDLPKLSLPKFLDTHQIEGIKWILSRSRSYLAHAPGAGKTAQAIIARDSQPG